MRSKRPRFPWRDLLRFAGPTFVGGIVVGVMLAGFRWHPKLIVHSGFIALSCFTCAIVLGWLAEPWLGQRGWLRGLVYFIGSQIGWPLALLIGAPLFWGAPLKMFTLSRAGWIAVVLAGVIGATAGVAVYTFELMKERLERSIAQLKEREFAEKELALARELQARMLPAPEVHGDGWTISGRNIPARYVAGDFYDIFRFPDGTVGVAIADVAGKGLAASLIMASVKSVLPLLVTSEGVGAMMMSLNAKLVGELTKREFVAIALLRFDAATGEVELANAGLPDPYLVRAGNVEPIVVGGPRLPAGLRAGLQYETTRLTLGEGQSIVLLSDGLPEAVVGDEPLGYDRLATILEESAIEGVDAVLRRVGAAAVADDDQTLVMLSRRARTALVA